MPTRVFVAGIGFDSITYDGVLKRVDDFLSGKISDSDKLRLAWGSNLPKKKFLMVTPNPEMVLAAQKNSSFNKILNSADLAVADGVGILWASYFLSLKNKNFFSLFLSLFAILFAPKRIRSVLPERVTGTDLLPRLLRLAAKRGKRVFLLGAAPGVAEKLKKKMEKKILGLDISGTFAGSPAEAEENEICSKIDSSKAELLFVAFGAPAQELWLARNLPKLKTVKFAAGIGGAFDFHAGIISRAPKILRLLSLEWLWRLIRQPKRLPRIWRATVRFIKLVWKNKAN